jgi:hypothetical protein
MQQNWWDLTKRRISDGRKLSDLNIELALLPRKTLAEQERYENLVEVITQELSQFYEEALLDTTDAVAIIAACNDFLSRTLGRKFGFGKNSSFEPILSFSVAI